MQFLFALFLLVSMSMSTVLSAPAGLKLVQVSNGGAANLASLHIRSYRYSWNIGGIMLFNYFVRNHKQLKADFDEDKTNEASLSYAQSMIVIDLVVDRPFDIVPAHHQTLIVKHISRMLNTSRRRNGTKLITKLGWLFRKSSLASVGGLVLDADFSRMT
ncbi:hypothetical protein FRB94_007547 [Tulasnella sp. JGI-2019a]|nr:hypothetical protein FRB94_007547 [Tulasnella sp. JGI-2019a]KAG9016094.1 hypothetical protein FRB93_011568 [Tulasnella sp. JGI-2019a]